MWYSPATNPGNDSLNHVLEYRGGSASPVAEYRFAATPDVRSVDERPDDKTISVAGSLGLMPAVQLIALAGRMTPAERASGARTVAWSVLVCLCLAGFALWLCRRSEFARDRTRTWTVLTIMLGPVALALMWAYLEWPARRRRKPLMEAVR